MKILSLFDGISCARVALERAGIPVQKYYASEVDKYAIQIAQKNYPDTIQIGDVKFVTKDMFNGIDLLIGGSPCQDLSIAKANRKGLDGDRSGLFWEYVRILKKVKPKHFILENVASMPKEARQVITDTLGVEPIMIDAALVSAQRRKRLFWVGERQVDGMYSTVNIPQPKDREIFLKDILEDGVVTEGKSYCVPSTYYKENVYRRTYWRETKGGKVPTLTANMGTGGNNVPYVEDKSYCVPSTYYKENVKSLIQRKKKGLLVGYEVQNDGTLKVREATKKGFAVAHDGDAVDLSFPSSKTRRGRVGNKAKNIMTGTPQIHVFTKGDIRKLTPIECERLQCLPDNYTEGVSNTQRYKALGNAFNVDVVAHILKHIEDR